MTWNALTSVTKSLILIALMAVPGLATAQGVSVQKNVTYSKSGQKLDYCKPKGEVRKTALIFIHGGGFSSGDRSAMRGFCELLARGGFPGVTISYRLTSAGHAFPAALQDVSTAVAWVRANEKALGVQIDKVVLIGYSAGGTLAMTTGLANGSNVSGVVSAAGISEFSSLRAATPHAKLRQDIDAYLGGAPSKAASPISQVSRGDPPVLLFHGKRDNLVPISQSVLMAQRLKAGGVKVLFRTFDNAGHEIMLPNPYLEQLLKDLTGFLVAIDKS